MSKFASFFSGVKIDTRTGFWFAGLVCAMIAIIGTIKVLHDHVVVDADLSCFAGSTEMWTNDQEPSPDLVGACHMVFDGIDFASNRTWLGGTVYDHQTWYAKFLAFHWVLVAVWFGAGRVLKISVNARRNA